MNKKRNMNKRKDMYMKHICFMESGLCLEYFCFLMEGLRNIHI